MSGHSTHPGHGTTLSRNTDRTNSRIHHPVQRAIVRFIADLPGWSSATALPARAALRSGRRGCAATGSDELAEVVIHLAARPHPLHPGDPRAWWPPRTTWRRS